MFTLYYCDQHDISLPEGHKFPAAKYRMVRSLLAAAGEFDLRPAPLASRADVELAHDPSYVRSMLDGSIDPHLMRRIGFPWSEQLARRTLASVGGTLAAAHDAMAAGFGGNLAGGTHHAFRNHGAGFCVFNDLAVAILALRREGLAKRAAVVDLDVHQGDGTASIFEGDPEVLTVSIHGENNFPFRKQRSSIDIALPDGTSDAGYLRCVSGVLSEVGAFHPDVVFYQAGVDALHGDRLGRLAMTPAGLSERDRQIFQTVKRLAIPVVVTLGGGYAQPIDRSAEAHARCYQAAARVLGD
jgi:acetoin utilization deacetylase AcuC-like enzyme